MSRAAWKGPFVEESLIKKVEKIKTDPNRKPVSYTHLRAHETDS